MQRCQQMPPEGLKVQYRMCLSNVVLWEPDLLAAHVARVGRKR